MHALLHPAVESSVRGYWSPPVNIYRTRAGWLVKFDVAGVARSDLQMAVSGRHLTVRGRRRDCCVEAGVGCSAYSMEITYREFHRTVELPGEVEHLRVITDYREGILLVQLVAQEETA